MVGPTTDVFALYFDLGPSVVKCILEIGLDDQAGRLFVHEP